MNNLTKNRAARPKYITKKPFSVITAVLWLGMAAFLLGILARPAQDVAASDTNPDITEEFAYMLSKKMSDIVQIDRGNVVFESKKRIYSLSDRDMVAPEPNPANYKTAEDPQALTAVLQEAQELLDLQTTLFTPQTEIIKGTKIHYYLDDTIFAVTWKQAVGGSTYTFSEVKLAHASQFRRFLADGKYGASAAYTTQEMAISVNAVVASAGDFYGYRSTGVCVNQGTVYRANMQHLDTCFIDENGDLLFSYRGELADKEALQKYVDDHKVRFSLSFGPVMIEDGKCVVPSYYRVGEIHDRYSRAALCQMGPLHYVVVDSNYEKPNNAVHTMDEFAQNLQQLGIPRAYALDGGQTATIVMNDQVINQVNYGAQRKISDIIYFATAIPEDERE